MDSAHDDYNVIPNLYEERAIGDSGKDVYSRLSSYPMHWQCPRFVRSRRLGSDWLEYIPEPPSTPD
jgi:hypothetical protein